MSFIIAIDGPGGVGKGTVTKAIAKDYNLLCVDTGGMYRCVAWEMIRNGISLEETEKIEKILENIQIELKEENDTQTVILNGEDVSMVIRSKEVSNMVSPMSDLKMIRHKMVELQRELAKGKNVIMEGRDIGTYVFPNADVKIYLDADLETRAKRRFLQNQEKGISDMTYEEVLENIKHRDQNDKQKEMGALKIAEDAIYIDTTTLSLDEEINKVKQIVEEKLSRSES